MVELISVTEAAKILGVHRTTIHRAIKDGRLRGVMQGGTRWKVARESLKDFALGSPNLTPNEIKGLKDAL